MFLTRYQPALLLILLLAATSCGNPLPELKNVDLEVWKNDRNGCNGTRTPMVDAFREQREKLRGLSEIEIVKLLGKPDRNELYERNQKFYHYFFEPGPDCAVPAQKPHILSIRFNATGLSKEVAVE